MNRLEDPKRRYAYERRVDDEMIRIEIDCPRMFDDRYEDHQDERPIPNELEWNRVKDRWVSRRRRNDR